MAVVDSLLAPAGTPALATATTATPIIAGDAMAPSACRH
jgi:hypothetical protein